MVTIALLCCKGFSPLVFITPARFTHQIVPHFSADYNYYDGMMPEFAVDEEMDFDDGPMEGAPAPGAGRGGAAGGAPPNEKTTSGASSPQYKNVESVRRDFPESWIWSEYSLTGYAPRMS